MGNGTALDQEETLQLGSRIRELRERRKLSLTAVAHEAGVSKSLLSQVERSRVNPSLPVARAIAKAIGVPLFSLFVEDESGNGVVRRSERQQLHVPGSMVRRELLVPDLQRKLMLINLYIGPGEESSPEPTSHSGEECIVVLSGSLEVDLDSRCVTLNTGDSLCFDPMTPHLFRNTSDEPAEAIVAGTGLII